ncbi:cob(I)yrinic acid a,c-diamide adenosyltransferase [Fusibacter ferrireducens]|uniref:Corrinoid adenosyltransferase n=1 Tax=Fusibacter ferrireducens TaxID=2785058 RepID=A0ABR9ZZP6_9FIRM|nr:cob(I)yrinic acid a,c-diamide adenosyltransferase [Fusibacter ferrireducens]MBF4695922.1 cob(I)yrinic acid a,c-diamide adenosyltransferase [Fusibacter ferrireducens]
MKVYTRGGDSGETSLYGGSRIKKSDPRVRAYGKVDAVNSHLGFLKAMITDEKLKHQLTGIQRDLFTLSTELATDMENAKRLKNRITEADVSKLEQIIDKWQVDLPELKDWIIPGEDVVSAYAHVTRTAVRDAERSACLLIEACDADTFMFKYLNRLSDYMFTLSRWLVYQTQVETIKRAVCKKLGEDHKMQVACPVPIGSKSDQMSPFIYSVTEEMKQACRQKAVSMHVAVNIAIVDEAGHLVFFERMADAFLGSIDIAINKAKTAVRFKNNTRTLGELAKPDQPLYGIQLTNHQEMVIFGGGYPIWHKGKIIGGIGVSGGTVEEDECIAEAGLKILSEVTA